MPIWFSCLISLVGVIVPSIALINNLRNSNKEKAEDESKRVANNTLVNFKLDSILEDVKAVKYDVSATKETVHCLSERLAKVESSTKSAHNRIDEIVHQKRRDYED